MKLREKTNLEICDENELKLSISTNVVEEKNAKNKMRATSNLIAKALIATLGPYGSSTIIQDSQMNHFATKDGYDLMNRMMFDDLVAKTILDLFRKTASNQVFNVGDGSTSAIVVANSLFQALTDEKENEYFKKVAPKDIIDMLNVISDFVEKELYKMAIPISDDMHELDIIAAIANNNDSDVGKVIGDIYRKIGEHGFISMDVLEKQEKDSYEIKKGIEWQRGYVDPIFSKMLNTEKIIYEKNPRIIISNSPLSYDDLELVLIPLIQKSLNQSESELLIVANDFSEDVLSFFKVNRTKHMTTRAAEMNFTAVDIDQVTKESRNQLEDLALLCGCRIYDKYLTQKADIVAHPDDFIGHASKVVITPKTTQVIARDDLDDAHQKDIQEKIMLFEDELQQMKSIECPTREEDRKIYELRERLSRLKASTALLHVGGRTMAERMTRQRLIEDAVFACKSAIKYGYIPGGNICIPKVLLDHQQRITEILSEKFNYIPVDNKDEFFTHFVNLIKDAFLESYKAVLNNSYMSEETVEKTIKTCLLENKFYNLKLHSFEDFNKTQVINSTATDLEILRSCISIIGILSTSNQFITLGMDMSGQIR